MKRLPSDLTREELEKAVKDLAEFYEFSFFGERDVDVSLGLTFAMEQMACSLGLVGEWLCDNVENYDSAIMMEDFGNLLDQTAMAMEYRPWMAFRADLPYSRGLQ